MLSPLPHVAVLATGGTIAGACVAGVSYQAGILNVNDLLGVLPGAQEWVSLHAEQVANVGSQDINAAIWFDLAVRLQELAADDAVQGCVITHGTDTMEETAWLLHLVLGAATPVVLTGAMRPADAFGADGPANLYDALAVASDPQSRGRGVMVVMDGRIHGARDVQKMSAGELGAFASPNRGVLGSVSRRQVIFHSPTPARAPELAGMTSGSTSSGACFPIEAIQTMARVPVLYVHGDMDLPTLNAVLDAGQDGLVVAGVGHGNASQAVLNRLERAAAEGCVVVRSTRTSKGRVWRNGEVDDDARGFVVANDLNPAKARLLLALLLQQTRDPAHIQAAFNSL